MKIKLLYNPNQWSNATAHFLEPLYKFHFDVQSIESNKKYNKEECVIYSHWINSDWTIPWHENGYKVVIDHLWDPWQNLNSIVSQPGKLVLRSNGWFCIANESIWYRSLGLNNYTKTNINDKTFLMLMNYQRPHRDQIWNKIQPYLTDAIFSYRDLNVELDNDIDRSSHMWQRYVNPEWYDRTVYSLVVETDIKNDPMVHSEKALKPIAFKQPMIVWGPAGYLKWLKSWGFETFSHQIDESYDLIENSKDRLDKIIEEVKILNSKNKNYFYDKQTQEILDHNYSVFYNESWAYDQFDKNLFSVIKEFANCG